jgi:hypothetical protein
MTRHRTITGFVAVALLAVAASAATMRAHLTSSEGIVVSGNGSMLKGHTTNEAPAASFDDRWSAMSPARTDTP